MTNQMNVNDYTNITLYNNGNIEIHNNKNNVNSNNEMNGLTSKVCCPSSSTTTKKSFIPPTSSSFGKNCNSSNWMDGSDMDDDDDDDDDDEEEKMAEKQLDVCSTIEQTILLPHPSELIALFEDFMHFGSVGLHIVNDKGIIVWANQAELDLLGYTKEEYFGQPVERVHHDMKCLNEILTTLLSGKQVINYIAPLKTKDGRIEYVQINSSMRQVNGHHTTTRCFSAVVTDRVLREQAIMEANVQKHESAIMKEQTERKTIFLRRLCHELRNPLQGIKGNLDLLLEELNDLKNLVAQQGNSSKTTTCCDNQMDSMDDKDNNDLQQIKERIDTALEYAESAHYAAEHQMLVINETLSLARLESEKDGLEIFNPHSVDMNDIIRQVHAIMGVKAFEKGINVQYNIVSEEAQHIRTDPCWLKQILINLISNAIQFTTTQQGNVIITIDTCQYNNNSTTTNNNNNNNKSKCCNNNKKSCNNNIALKVTIKDNGIGMTDDEQQKIFDGSGLGLKIIQQMLYHVGGSVEIIESTKDIGSTFQFIMPCEIIINDDKVNNNNITSPPLEKQDVQQEICATPSSCCDVVTVSTLLTVKAVAATSLIHQSIPFDDVTKTSPLPHDVKVAATNNNNNNMNKENVRILIVDDSPMNLKILSNFLRKNGYTKHEMAQHGKEAYEMHQNNPYDLIMTDIDMPYMDGLELTKQIRNREEKKRLLDDNSSDHLIIARKIVTIIGISGNVLPEDSALATEVGMNEYVGKPYRFPMIEALIEKHIFLNNNICQDKNVIVTS